MNDRVQVTTESGAQGVSYRRLLLQGGPHQLLLAQLREQKANLQCLCTDPPILLRVETQKTGAQVSLALVTDAASAGAHASDCLGRNLPIGTLTPPPAARTKPAKGIPSSDAAVQDGIWRDRRVYDRLNAAQKDAANHRDGPCLVVAAAGSGKTAMLIARIGRLIEQGVPASAIVACTFTNKATDEMRERLTRAVGKVPVTLGTMHSLAFRMVIPEYDDTWRLITETTWMIDRVLQPGHPKYNPHGLGLKLDAKEVQLAISRAKADGLRPTDVEGDIGRIYAAYEAMKYEAKRLDFDDLLLEAVRRFQESETFAAKWQARWDYVLVDEFQDTNRVQWQFVQALAQRHHNLLAVGDDWQSIYGFRGARPALMRAFTDVYPDAAVKPLTRNYRSHDLIVDLGAQVIALCRGEHLDKTVVADREATDAAEAEVVSVKDETEEAQWVARKITALHARHPEIPLSDYAVLYRINVQSRAVEEALIAADLPVQLVGDTHFYESRDVDTLLRYLRTAQDTSDPEVWAPILNRPMRYIAKTRIELARQDGWQALTHDDRGLAFVSTIERLRRHEKPGDALRWLIETQPGIVRESDEPLRWIDSLLASADRYETYGQFLRYVDYVIEKSKEPKDDAVWMSSIHASKGLEFHTVFVVGLVEGLLPHKHALEEGGDVAEETRLAYVAITRAKENVFLLHARTYGGQALPVSRFVEALE